MRFKGVSTGRFSLRRKAPAVQPPPPPPAAAAAAAAKPSPLNSAASAKPSPLKSAALTAASPKPSSSSDSRSTAPAPALPSHRDLEEVFRKFDSNGDGKISRSELSSVMSALECRATEEEIDRMMKEADSNKDGFISFEEFVAANTKDVDNERVTRDLESAFKMYDLDNDGRISVDELYRVLKNLGEVSSFQECQQMIKSVDSNNRDSVSFQDFKAMMTARRP